MASYSVVLKSSVEKDLRSLSKATLKRVWAKIEVLGSEPLPRQAIKLAGAENLYRLRVGDYRIICTFDPANKQIIIQYVRHRSQAYR